MKYFTLLFILLSILNGTLESSITNDKKIKVIDLDVRKFQIIKTLNGDIANYLEFKKKGYKFFHYKYSLKKKVFKVENFTELHIRNYKKKAKIHSIFIRSICLPNV